MDLSERRTQNENLEKVHGVGTTEDFFPIFTKLRDHLHIDLDMDIITVPTIIRIYEEIDGANEVIESIATFPTDFGANVKVVGINLNGAAQDMRISVQSTINEPGIVTIKYSVKTLTRP